MKAACLRELSFFALVGLSWAIPTTKEYKGPSQESIIQAKAILDKYPIIDGHNDFVMGLRTYFENDLTNFDFNTNLSAIEPWASHYADDTDIPRMKEGRVGGQFWSSFISCDAQYKDAVQLFMEQIDVIKRLVQDNPNDMTFVTDAQGIEQAFADKKIASLIGVESGHAIGESLGMLRMLYELGARYMTLTHTCNTPWADAAQVESGELPVRSDGLSDFGKLVVQEMNRLGMLVDLSHVSARTMADAMDVTRAPVIFSHSSARSVYDHPRNVPDEILSRLTDIDGIVMVNFFSCFVVPDCSENHGNVLDIVAHVNKIREVAGVDHVGIGSDFCGVDISPEGLEDSAGYPNLFAALLEDGWTEEELGKLASGNLIRVFKAVEAIRDTLTSEEPFQAWIPSEEVQADESQCRMEPW
ncbi:dipeptidase 1-like isoform X1 [Tigriopus californicus]|nr:dipeptidase 1-like isoform X1 [Tigriopus californicus]